VDLIWAPRGKSPAAIECKWSARDFNPANLLVFARRYPKTTLLVTTPDARPAFTRNYSGIEVQFLTRVNSLIHPYHQPGLVTLSARIRSAATTLLISENRAACRSP